MYITACSKAPGSQGSHKVVKSCYSVVTRRWQHGHKMVTRLISACALNHAFSCRWSAEKRHTLPINRKCRFRHQLPTRDICWMVQPFYQAPPPLSKQTFNAHVWESW